MEISAYTKDHFDFVVNGGVIYDHENCPDRWPDKGNGAYCDQDPEDAPEIEWVDPTRETLVATQDEVSVDNVEYCLKGVQSGADLPPVVAIRCKDGLIVWNGHHRSTAHRVAKSKKMKVRIWATFDETVEELCNRSEELVSSWY